MSDPELPWKLLVKEDGVWLHHSRLKWAHMDDGQTTLINLGPKEQVMEAFSQFLCEQDFGE